MIGRSKPYLTKECGGRSKKTESEIWKWTDAVMEKKYPMGKSSP